MNKMILHENHLGNAVSSEIRLFREKIRHRAVNYNESTQTVIGNCLDNLSDDTVTRIPKFKHIKRNIENSRNEHNLYLKRKHLIEFQIYEHKQNETISFCNMILAQEMILLLYFYHMNNNSFSTMVSSY